MAGERAEYNWIRLVFPVFAYMDLGQHRLENWSKSQEDFISIPQAEMMAGMLADPEVSSLTASRAWNVL